MCFRMNRAYPAKRPLPNRPSSGTDGEGDASPSTTTTPGGRTAARWVLRNRCSRNPQKGDNSATPPAGSHAIGVRSRSSMDTPSGPVTKAIRVPGRIVTGSRLNIAPLDLSSAHTASMFLT